MSNPYESPQYAPPPLSAGVGPDAREKLRQVARYQQWVLYALLGNIGVNVLVIALQGAGFEGISGLLALVVGIPVIIFGMVAIYLLANQLYNAVIGVVCALLMIVPCISLLTLLIVNQKATTYLQERGVKVGFMGADPNLI